MTIRYVAAREPAVGNNSIGNPGSLVLPNSPSVGDLLIAVSKQNANGVASISNLAAPYGAKQLGNAAHYVTPLHGAAGVGQSATLTATCTAAPTACQLGIGEFTGVTDTEDVTAAYTNGGSGNLTTLGTGNVVTTTAECLLIAWLGLVTANSQPGITIDSGFYIFGRANQFAVAHKIVAATGTYSAAWSWATSCRASAGMLAFRASATPAKVGFLGF